MHTLPYAFTVMVATPLGALAALRLGTRYVVSIGLLVIAVALVWMSRLAAGAAYLGPIIGAMITLAVGFSLVNAPSVAATMETLELDQIGRGRAGNETTRELGGTMGVAIIGSVFASLFGPAIHRGVRAVSLLRAERTPTQRRAEFDGGGQDDGVTPFTGGPRRCWPPS